MSPIDPRDVRDKRISFRPATPEQKTAITGAARDAGVSASTWIRDLLVDETGHEDMARRRAVQRPRQRRAEENGNAPPIIRVSQREKAAIERRAARARKDVSDWARDVIEAELDRTEGQQS